MMVFLFEDRLVPSQCVGLIDHIKAEKGHMFDSHYEDQWEKAYQRDAIVLLEQDVLVLHADRLRLRTVSLMPIIDPRNESQFLHQVVLHRICSVANLGRGMHDNNIVYQGVRYAENLRGAEAHINCGGLLEDIADALADLIEAHL